MNKTLIARAGAATAVVVALLFGSMTPAQAAVPASTSAVNFSAVAVRVPTGTSVDDGSGGDTSGPSGASGSCGTKVTGADQSPMLPVTRWSDATARMHSRIDAGPLGVNAELIQRNALQNGGMSTGNFMWTTGAGLASFAINFCLLDTAGGAADHIGATIANSLTNPSNGLLAALVFVGVLGLIFAGARRGNILWKPVLMKAMIVGVFFIMAMGATNSHGGGSVAADGSVDNSPYRPGVGSPGWVVTKVNGVVSSLAAAPAAALAVDPGPTSGPSGDPLACNNYTASLKREYTNTYGGGAGSMSSSVPLILSSIWETTGLKAWRVAQFGTAMDGTMSDHVWCHLLEQNAQVPVGTVSDRQYGSVQTIMNRVFNSSGVPAPAYNSNFYHSSAFSTPDNVTQDKSLVAWAACRLKGGATNLSDSNSWTTDAFNKGIKDGGSPSGADCEKAFAEAQDGDGAFDWSSNGDDVNKRTDAPDQAAGHELRTFIRTLHGNDVLGGMTSILAYNISALGMLIVFGMIALAIIISKVALVVMIVIAFFLMLQALMPGSDMSKLGGFLKTILGMNLFVFSIQLVFAFVTVFTKMLQAVGDGMLGGESSLIATLWSGLAPLVAVAILHMMFTKVMKVPSPFSISGGLSWGNAMGAAAGGAAFAGVSSLLERGQSRMKSRAAGAVKGSGRGALNTAMSRVTGSRAAAGQGAGRRNAAEPVGESTAKNVLSGAAIEASRRKVKGQESGEGVEEATDATAAGAEATESADTAATAAGATTAAAAPGTAGSKAKFDHTLLSTSRVLNSQLHKGKMSAAERAALKQGGADEREATEAWKQQQREDMGLTKVSGIKAKVGDSLGNAKDAFLSRPFHVAGKAAKKTVGTAALGAGLLVAGTATGGLVPLAYAGYKVATHARKTYVKNRTKMDADTLDYRQMMEKTKRVNDGKGGGKGSKGNNDGGQQGQSGSESGATNPTTPTVADTPASRQRPTGAPNTAPIQKVTVSPIAEHLPAEQAPETPTSARPERASR